MMRVGRYVARILCVVASSVVSFSCLAYSLQQNTTYLIVKIITFILVSILSYYSRLSPAVLWLTELQVSEKVHVWFRISGDILTGTYLGVSPDSCVSILTPLCSWSAF